jgi:hypothetical protein
MDPVPDPRLLRKPGNAGNRTRDLLIFSQELWPLDHRGGRRTYTVMIFSQYVLVMPLPPIFTDLEPLPSSRKAFQPWMWITSTATYYEFRANGNAPDGRPEWGKVKAQCNVWTSKLKLKELSNIMFLDITHRPVFIWNTLLFIFKNTTFWRLDSVSVFGKTY